LDGEEGEAGGVARFELDQDIHVAFGGEIGPQDRTEECEPADMASAAEVLDLVPGYVDAAPVHPVTLLLIPGN
jgi:hypothetical protein